MTACLVCTTPWVTHEQLRIIRAGQVADVETASYIWLTELTHRAEL
jgi:hypothetical protein